MDMNDIINRHAKAARRVAVPAKTQIDPVIIEMMTKAADRHFDAIMAHKHAGIPAWEDAVTVAAWHFTGDTLRDDRPTPAVGEWLVHEGPIAICMHAHEAAK